MEAIYDRNGKLVAWGERDTIYDTNLNHIAFRDGFRIFAYDSHHLGWLWDGYIRDRQGYAVGFTSSANSFPALPLKEPANTPPVRPSPISHPSPQKAPSLPVLMNAWSDWRGFLK